MYSSCLGNRKSQIANHLNGMANLSIAETRGVQKTGRGDTEDRRDDGGGGRSGAGRGIRGENPTVSRTQGAGVGVAHRGRAEGRDPRSGDAILHRPHRGRVDRQCDDSGVPRHGHFGARVHPSGSTSQGRMLPADGPSDGRLSRARRRHPAARHRLRLTRLLDLPQPRFP